MSDFDGELIDRLHDEWAILRNKHKALCALCAEMLGTVALTGNGDATVKMMRELCYERWNGIFERNER